ncbi:unnamed protein product [Owenia fusiformis]|uniref:Uncharacterized protein n=1 Tax=Owenia fusiformis TaxID=6347 RepID=A0A8J1TR83_OWEFU|nr:unnamed protein product [Owenia fusiformis]
MAERETTAEPEPDRTFGPTSKLNPDPEGIFEPTSEWSPEPDGTFEPTSEWSPEPDGTYEPMSEAELTLEPLSEFGNGASFEPNSEFEPEPETGEVTPEMVILLNIYAIFIALIILGNLCVVVTLLSKKKLRTTTNMYLVSLSLADLFIGAFVVPAAIMSQFSEQYLGSILCKLCQFVSHGSIACSIFSILAIALDRFNSIALPFRGKISFKQSIITVIVIWCAAFAYASRAIIMYDLVVETFNGDTGWTAFWTCSISRIFKPVWNIVILVDSIVLFWVPLIIISLVYGIISKKLLSMPIQNKKDSHSIRGKQRVVKMLITLVVLFLLCHLPLHALYLYIFWGPGYFPKSVLVIKTFEVFSFSNSWLNVIAYSYFNENLRNTWKEELGKSKCFKNRFRVSPIKMSSKSDMTANSTTNTCSSTSKPQQQSKM